MNPKDDKPKTPKCDKSTQYGTEKLEPKPKATVDHELAEKMKSLRINDDTPEAEIKPDDLTPQTKQPAFVTKVSDLKFTVNFDSSDSSFGDLGEDDEDPPQVRDPKIGSQSLKKLEMASPPIASQPAKVNEGVPIAKANSAPNTRARPILRSRLNPEARPFFPTYYRYRNYVVPRWVPSTYWFYRGIYYPVRRY